MENKADILYLLDGNGILNIEGDTDNEVLQINILIGIVTKIT